VAREVWWTVLRGYHDDMKRARDRITAAASMTLRTQFGIIEYADRGAGTPLLVSHGVLGCHVDGVDGYWSTLPGPGFRVIAPARFGYFGSTLPRDASPADQADAYRLLLDHLGVERAVVIGYSAGSASVLEFAARHPSRVIALILASARLGGGVTLNKRLEPALRVAYGSDLLFWIFKRLLPSAYARMMGAPKGYRPTPAEARTLAGYLELLFPLTPSRGCDLRRVRLQRPRRPVPPGRPRGSHPGHQRGRRPTGPVPVRRRCGGLHSRGPAADHRAGWTSVSRTRHAGARRDCSVRHIGRSGTGGPTRPRRIDNGHRGHPRVTAGSQARDLSQLTRGREAVPGPSVSRDVAT
jgi:pimeloyl-ACP methyl ester carboxylesterase